MGKYLSAVSEMYSQFEKKEAHPMEKYLSAVSEMYSQFKKKEAHPMEKYVGRLARCTWGGISEVVGYSTCPDSLDGPYCLIVGCPKTRGWDTLRPCDVVFKECEGYWYVRVSDLV